MQLTLVSAEGRRSAKEGSAKGGSVLAMVLARLSLDARASAVVDSTRNFLAFGSADIAETVAAAARTGAGIQASPPIRYRSRSDPWVWHRDEVRGWFEEVCFVLASMTKFGGLGDKRCHRGPLPQHNQCRPSASAAAKASFAVKWDADSTLASDASAADLSGPMCLA